MMLVYASVSFSKTLWLPGQGRHAEGGTTPPTPLQHSAKTNTKWFGFTVPGSIQAFKPHPKHVV